MLGLLDCFVFSFTYLLSLSAMIFACLLFLFIYLRPLQCTCFVYHLASSLTSWSAFMILHDLLVLLAASTERLVLLSACDVQLALTVIYLLGLRTCFSISLFVRLFLCYLLSTCLLCHPNVLSSIAFLLSACLVY